MKVEAKRKKKCENMTKSKQVSLHYIIYTQIQNIITSIKKKEDNARSNDLYTIELVFISSSLFKVLISERVRINEDLSLIFLAQPRILRLFTIIVVVITNKVGKNACV